MNEDRIRRLLGGLASSAPPQQGRWDALVARRRRRQAVQASGVGAAGLAVVLVALLAMPGGGQDRSLVTTDASQTPSPTATATVPPSAPRPTLIATSPAASPTEAPTPAGSAVPAPVTATKAPPPSLVLGAVGAWSRPARLPLVSTTTPRTGVPALLRSWAAHCCGERRVELHVVDSHGSAAELLQGVKDLVGQGVDAFVATDVDGPVESYLRSKGVPVLGGDLASPLWSSSPVLFAQGTDGTALADGLAVLGARGVTGTERQFGVVCMDAPACNTAAALVEQGRAALYGLDPTRVERVAASSSDFTGAVIRMRQAGVDVVALALPAPQAVGFTRSAADQGWHPRLVLGSDLAADAAVVDEPLLRGVLTPQQVLPWPVAPAAFRTALPDGAQPSAWLTSAWAATQLAAATSAELSGGPVTPAGVLAAVRRLAGETVDGLLPALAPQHVQRCFFVAAVGTGTWEAPQELRTSCGKP